MKVVVLTAKEVREHIKDQDPCDAACGDAGCSFARKLRELLKDAKEPFVIPTSLRPQDRKELLKRIKHAVEVQLPEDEPDCTRDWVYETAIREVLRYMRQWQEMAS